MPPHLHPRSSATTTLFASTLAASFIIVGIPHIFPCPAPRTGYLDEEGKIVRRRRSRGGTEGVDVVDKVEGPGRQRGTADAQVGLGGELRSLLGSDKTESGSPAAGRVKGKGGDTGDEEEDVRALFREMEEEAAMRERERRECPVPKPGGKIGELLGFGGDGRRRKVEDEREMSGAESRLVSFGQDG